MTSSKIRYSGTIQAVRFGTSYDKLHNVLTHDIIVINVDMMTGSQVLAQAIRISEGIHYVTDFKFCFWSVSKSKTPFMTKFHIFFYSVRMTGSF